jgi:hypothetical protein
MLDFLRWNRRPLLITAAILASLTAFLVGAALVLHASNGSPADHRQAAGPATEAPSPAQQIAPSSAPASDVASWDALPAVAPAVSVGYPAIPAAARSDPSAFAAAFAEELFTRNYATTTRAQLLSWAQYESAPLRSPNYPAADWTKVLVDSLTDLKWDSATQTEIPADGPWLALRAERAEDRVSDVRTNVNPTWEQKVAAGYQAADRLMTVIDVSLTVTETVHAGGSTQTTRYSLALALQLGTSARGGYGVAAANNFVMKEA